MNSIPVVTKNILIINVLCFFGSVVAAKYGIDLNDLLGLHFFLASDFNPAQLITYMFMHAGFQHIFFNMFAVWMFGRTLEQVWGPKRFLFYYILCGIGAGLVQEGVQYIQYVTELVNYEGVNTGVAVIPMAEYLNLMTTVGENGNNILLRQMAEYLNLMTTVGASGPYMLSCWLSVCCSPIVRCLYSRFRFLLRRSIL